MHSVEEVLQRMLEEKYFLPLEKETQPCCFVQYKLCLSKPELCSAELGAGVSPALETAVGDGHTEKSWGLHHSICGFAECFPC